MNESVSPQTQIIQHLQQEFARAQIRREGYSLRRFAKALGVAPPVLSQVLNHKLKITRKLAEKLLASLKIDQDEIEMILRQIPAKQTRKPASGKKLKKPDDYSYLSTSAFNLISDWWYFAILSLAETEACKSDPRWVAKRLNITPTQARKGIQTLQKMKLLKVVNRKLSVSGDKLSTAKGISSIAVRRNHIQGMELARDALENTPIENREFGASVIAGDPALMEEVKAFLQDTRFRAAAMLQSGKKKEVYRLQIQLFPISKKTGEK